MQDKFNQLLSSIVNEDYSVLLSGAKDSLAEAFQIFSRYASEDEAAGIVTAFLAAAIAVDGTFTAKEQQFICDLFGDIDFLGILTTVDDNLIGYMDELTDALSPEEKATLCLLAAYVVAVDEEIGNREYRYLLKLMD